jgi:hypothetical protein
MTRRRVIGIMFAAVCAFAASSIWYSPVLFGKQFFALSGVAATAKPAGLNIAAEILRNVLLAFVISRLLILQEASRLKTALRLAAILWVGFPFTLLSGSVLWQNVPIELAQIHCGDWLIKILLMTLILWFVNRNTATRLQPATVHAVQPS